MLNQETDFKYEIIVHDDCSQDATPEILKSYIAKYPDKIRIILQNENQHSKGTNILDDIVLPVARGKYIAFAKVMIIGLMIRSYKTNWCICKTSRMLDMCTSGKK